MKYTQDITELDKILNTYGVEEKLDALEELQAALQRMHSGVLKLPVVTYPDIAGRQGTHAESLIEGAPCLPETEEKLFAPPTFEELMQTFSEDEAPPLMEEDFFLTKESRRIQAKKEEELLFPDFSDFSDLPEAGSGKINADAVWDEHELFAPLFDPETFSVSDGRRQEHASPKAFAGLKNYDDTFIADQCQRMHQPKKLEPIEAASGWNSREENNYSDEAFEEILKSNAAARTLGSSSERMGGKYSRFLRRAGSFFLFMAVVAFFVTGISAVAGKSGGIWGFSMYTVLTDSMQSEIPRGSLVFVKETNPADIEIGDDITFFMGNEAKVTHRVISITEDYGGSGRRGFETKGVENPLPDNDIVTEENVVGKVVFKIPGFGKAADYVWERWSFILLPLAGLSGALLFIRILLKKEEEYTFCKSERMVRI